MRIVIALMMVALLVCPALAVQVEISQETIDTLVEMGVDDPAAYLKNITDKHDRAKVDKDWNKLTIAEKKDKLKKK